MASGEESEGILELSQSLLTGVEQRCSHIWLEARRDHEFLLTHALERTLLNHEVAQAFELCLPELGRRRTGADR